MLYSLKIGWSCCYNTVLTEDYAVHLFYMQFWLLDNQIEADISYFFTFDNEIFFPWYLSGFFWFVVSAGDFEDRIFYDFLVGEVVFDMISF